MANKFGIPVEIEKALRKKDKTCAYCRKEIFLYENVKGSPKDKATIEHLNFDGPFYWSCGLKESDLVICCQSCNSSRGVKKLEDWFEGSYCKDRDINTKTVSGPVREYIDRKPI